MANSEPNSRVKRPRIVTLLMAAALLVGICFAVWYFLIGYTETAEVVVTADSEGVYKRWSMQRNIENYVSQENCRTVNGTRNCTRSARWELRSMTESSGIFGIDEPVEPPPAAFRTCQNLIADTGCQRERLEQHWQVGFEISDGSDQFWCDVPKAQWDDNFALETVWRIERNRAMGWLCGTLKPV